MLNRVPLTAIETVDKQNPTGGTSVGHGEFANVRYRGTVFTPSQAIIDSIAFKMNGLGSGKDMDIFLIDVNQSTNIPTGAVLQKWTIPIAQLALGLKTYALSPAYASLTPSHKYAFYFGPSSSGSYVDDYRDMDYWNGAPKNDGVIEITNTNGVWSTENLVHIFQTFYASAQTRNTASSRGTATGRTQVP